jgi:hypothetical protein
MKGVNVISADDSVPINFFFYRENIKPFAAMTNRVTSRSASRQYIAEATHDLNVAIAEYEQNKKLGNYVEPEQIKGDMLRTQEIQENVDSYEEIARALLKSYKNMPF